MHRCQRVVAWMIAALLTGATPPARADDAASRAEIAAALTQWTADFNAGRADKVCDLLRTTCVRIFAASPSAQRSLGDSTRTFSYALAVKEILVWGDAAVVRLTWTLTIRDKGRARDVTSVEPGLDVFRRQDDGRWRIVRYMAYEQ